MIYLQSNDQLRYKNFPLASHLHFYDPNNAQQLSACREKGGYHFCIPHNHLALEIMYVLRGEARVVCGGKEFTVFPEDVAFFNPFQVHAIIAPREEQYVEFQIINVDLSLLKNQNNNVYDCMIADLERGVLEFRNYIPHDALGAEEIGRTLMEIHKAYGTNPEVSSFMRIMSSLYRLIVILYDNAFFDERKDKNYIREVDFTQKVVQYVSENLTLPLSTRHVSEAMHLEKSYFCRLFRSMFGQNFMDYFHEYRISVAKNLSVGKGITLNDIARSVGYTNYDVFATHFKRCVGMTPKVYYQIKHHANSSVSL